MSYSKVKLIFLMVGLISLSACDGNQPDSTESIEQVVKRQGAPAEVLTSELSKPNIIVILADDMGYSDIGVYGGEIETPHIDALAASGVRFSNFYSSLTCSPSRAMLMTGADNHLVGLGNMAETIADNQLSLPGYETFLNDRVETLAEALKGKGYRTYMAGKWHLGLEPEMGPAARGFDKSFSLLFGGGSHYDNSYGPDAHRPQAYYRDEGKLLDKAPAGFFSSTFYTDRIIQNIQGDLDSNKPFFAFLGFTAPHWPLQFPPNYDGKYQDTYTAGWDEISAARLQRQKDLGIVDSQTVAAPEATQWSSLNKEQQAYSAKTMEIYASLVDDMDAQIGRLLAYLKESDQYDNTVIVFLSDNGADAWGNVKSPPPIRDWANRFNNSYENAGQPDSYIMYGPDWARVSNTPFKDSKGNTSEGGIRVPLIIHLPERMLGTAIESINSEVTGIEDIMPTLLQVAGADTAASDNQLTTDQIRQTGRSILSLLKAADIADSAEAQASTIQSEAVIGREMWGKRSVRLGDWKIINQPPPTGTGQWQLYNLKDDLAEQIDLATGMPEKLEEMKLVWQQYADRNNVVLPEGGFRIREAGPLPKN
jgi:arylsulfatase